jgi:branched-chain amino acid transport system permease protein
LFVTAYITRVIFITLVFITFTVSYNIVGGYLGYVNLGHGAFFALGAYTFVILVTKMKIPIPPSILLGAVVAAAFAGLVSYPLFRLRGAYFSIASWGLVILLNQLAVNLDWLTGGVWGVQLPIPSAEASIPAYYSAIGIMLLATAVSYLIYKGGFGLALFGIREDERVAANFGVNPFKYKCLSMMVSAFFAGLIGAVYVFNIGVINPSTVLSIDVSLAPVVMVLVGGVGTLSGPVVGAAVLTLVQEILWTKTEYFHLLTYGVILVLVGLFMPGGLARSKKLRRIVVR